MSRTWTLHEAKERLGEVVDKALTEGPQTISRRDAEAVVVISARDLERLRRPGESLVEFLSRSPLEGLGVELERDKDTGRR